MTKKGLNQNAKYEQELINTFEPNFSFVDGVLNRFENPLVNTKKLKEGKLTKLTQLKKEINSIENCNFKINSKNIVFGYGDINSPVMLIGEAPGEEEDRTGVPFQGEVGELLKKMLKAINIDIKKTYLTYSIKFIVPQDKKPNVQEITRYSRFLKDHISIINPKIIILMGHTAMYSVTGLNNKISDERGKWKEMIVNNNSIPIITTFNPSYLIRFPENKKYSWIDLKKIKQKIFDLNIIF